jgi:hypothetical protein
MRRRGAIERDTGARGLLAWSGDFHRWEARPPSASMGVKREQSSTRVPIVRTRSKGRGRVRLSLNRAAYRTLA